MLPELGQQGPVHGQGGPVQGNDKADLHNATDDHELDTPMEEVPKVYIAYMLEVKDEEDCDEREIVAKHTCGLSRRTVVSPSREGSCGNPPWSTENPRRIGLPRVCCCQMQVQVQESTKTFDVIKYLYSYFAIYYATSTM